MAVKFRLYQKTLSEILFRAIVTPTEQSLLPLTDLLSSRYGCTPLFHAHFQFRVKNGLLVILSQHYTNECFLLPTRQDPMFDDIGTFPIIL